MKSNRALLIVDVQKAFEDEKWGERNNLQAEVNIRKLLGAWRANGDRVIYIQHRSDDPASVFYHGQKGYEIKNIVKPEAEDCIFTKKVNSAFIGTTLENYLHENNLSEVVITGLTTPHCVSTTTRMSGNLGFNTYLISDATAAYGLTDENGRYHDPELVHMLTLATLHEEFATVLTTEELLKTFDLVSER
ncbi:cysteine hydrolase family protein [Bacillus sp. es.036]|uniref:cysteine hydrolase family protein n=1 Tax=Bacillus sp. es.036 TaxID=1761764 RepID=UPI000BF72606|nr:cysteine hydrolase family protein [Bacillus sp. es.036]PFG12177.1 nicotinamidase-related amidase [Bacillus sp. es.036]